MLVYLETLIEDELNRKWEDVERGYNGPLVVVRRSMDDDQYAGLIIKHETYPEFAISYATDLGSGEDSILVYLDDDYTQDFISGEEYYNAMCEFAEKFKDDIEEVGRLLDIATDRITVM